ncbi:MAG: DUF937 domain-containing protein [Alphaproteobacteria bacterium]|jgi:hypothetical protein|nr:DUF937 domain-containing protein [Alphaproteobacteria bacterium]
MAGLLDLLAGPQAQPAKQQLGQQFGLSDDMTQKAMSALIPALAAGLKSNASKQGGVESLLEALNNGSHKRYLDDPGLLGRPETRDEGNGILGHLLGSKEVSRAVASRASEKTGIGDDLLKQMLPVVATMVMGSLAKKSEEPDTLSQLAGILGGGQRQPQQQSGGLGGLLGGLFGGGRQKQPAQSDGLGMLGALFDADRDGSAMDDIFEMVLKQRR